MAILFLCSLYSHTWLPSEMINLSAIYLHLSSQPVVLCFKKLENQKKW